jgi:Protein of unknown function (DUF2939)
MAGKFLALILVLAGTGVYATPYIAVRSMQAAVEAKDAETLGRYVNFPVLKENLKRNFSTKMTQGLSADSNSPFAAFGAALSSALVSPMVDALVTTDGLALLLKGEQPVPNSSVSPAAARGAADAEADSETTMSYENVEHFLVSIKKKNSPDTPLGLIFQREKLIFWKLVDVRLPI